MNEIAYFAAGCFWHVQDTFDKTPGVIETEAGYMGGDETRYPLPTYELVCSGNTGYVETVKVAYDSAKISYKQLLDIFWGEHDPTSYNKQGNDSGSQYGAFVFYINDEQKREAEESWKEAEKKYSGKKIYTMIERAGKFFGAEEYHQHYLSK